MPENRQGTRPNLEYYRKAAKSLLKAAQSGDSAARARMERFFPGAEMPFALHHAQLTIAREQGFASWPRFRNFLVESALDFAGLVAKFIDAALDNRPQAEEMLSQHPEIAGAGFFVALVLGDTARVEGAIAESPGIATAKGGPRNWAPLSYVCFSRFAAARSPRAGDLTATARVLLAHGADPNGFHEDEHWPDNPFPCLYGASGLNNNVALTSLLLDAGASADDDESLYHSSEHADLACFRVLLERATTDRATKVLNHMLDKDDLTGLRLLLAAGADPNRVNKNGETSLHWAVWRGRSVAIIETLLDAGVEVDVRRKKDGRTAYALAVQSGQTATAKLLASRGANTDVPALDAFIGKLAAAELPDRLVSHTEQLPDEYSTLLPDLASSHCTSGVRALLAAGIDVNTMGHDGCTALHWACWKGYADLVKLLLDHGASLDIEDSAYHATPAGWLDHGRGNSIERGDYELTERILREAGAKIE